jgi:hypothetical protein
VFRPAAPGSVPMADFLVVLGILAFLVAFLALIKGLEKV